MSSVDNRVVRMTFDNSQFERNIKTTQKSIEEFEKSLKFDGATASFDELSKATNKLDLSAISKKASDEAVKIESISSEAGESISKIDDAAQNADFSPLSSSAQDASQDVNNAISSIDMSSINDGTSQASEGFSALEVIATGALFRIGESISDLVTGGLASIGNTIKKYTFDPITEGFKEYETQMGSIQTIMANTGLNFGSDDDIALVNSRLDELNTYADKTIYNFTEMTRNIGTFTAAGVGLDESTKAIQGIANMAALSGSNSQQASTAMYQLSQALAAGSLKLQDWNSVVNAGMGGKVFQESLKRTARAHGIAVDEMIAANGSFRESLQEGWISSEILTETLNQLAISYERKGDAAYNSAYASLKDAGYSDEDAEAILKLAKQAELAATEVRTWTQLWDTVGEAIGSNWSQIWRNVIGDFKQATDTFTFLSEQITKAIDGMLGGIVHASEIFNKSGAIGLIFGGYVRNEEGERAIDEITGTATRIKGAIDYLAEAIGKPLGAIKDAFDSIFGMDDDTLALTITSIAMAFKDFTQTLIISDDAAIAIKNIFEGLFSILDIGIQIVMDLGAAFFGVVDFIRSFLDPIIDSVLTVFGQLGRIIMWVHDRFLEVRAAVIQALQPFLELIGIVRDAISSFFGFADIPGHIRSVGDGVLAFLDILWGFVDIPGIIKGIGEALGAIFHFIGDLTGWNAAVEESKNAFDEAGNKVSAFDIWIQKLLQNPVIGFFKGIIDAIGGFIGSIKDSIVNILHLNDTGEKLTLPGIFKKIADSVLGALGPVGEFVSKAGEGLSGISEIVGKLAGAFGGFASKLWEAFTSWEPIQNVINKLNEFKDGAINFFLSLPERLSGTADGVEGPLSSIQNMFGGVIDWFNGVIDYFSNVSVEQFIEDVKSWANGVIENVKGIFDYFTNTSPEQIFEDFIESMHSGLANGYNVVSGFAKHLDKMFPELNGAFENGLHNAYVTLYGLVSDIHDFIAPVLAESDSIPDFFIRLFVKIGSSIRDGIANVIDGIRNFNISDLGNILEGVAQFFMNAAKTIEDTFPALQGVLTGKLSSVFDSIGNFYRDITKDADNFGDVLSNIFGKIGENLQQVPDVVGRALGWLKDRVGEGAAWIAEKLRSIPGPIGEFFKWLTDNLAGLEQPINNAIDQIKKLFDSIKKFIFGGSETSSSENNPVNDVVNTFTDTDIDKQSGGFGTIIDKIKEFFDEKLGKLNDFMSGIPGRIGEMLSGFAEKLKDQGVIQTVINIIQQVLVAKLIWSLSDFIRGVGNLTNVAAKYLKQEKVKSFSEKFKDVAIAFGIIAASLFVISMIEDPWPCVGILAAIGAVIVAMEAVSGLVCKKFNKKAGDQLLKSAATIGVFAASMLLVMYTVKKLTAFDWAGNVTGLVAMGVAMGVLAGLVIAITKFGGKGGKEALKAAASLAILALAINIMMPAVMAISEFAASLNESQLGQAAAMLVLFGVFVAGMAASLRLVGDNSLKASASMLILAIAIGAIAEAVLKLSGIDLLELLASFGGLVAILATFGIIAKVIEDPNDLIKTAAAMVIFGASVAIMAVSLSVLAQNDWTGIIAASAAIAILVGSLGLLAAFTKEADLITTSVAIIAFSVGVGIMALALAALAQVEPDRIAAAAIAIGALLVVFGALVVILSLPVISEAAMVILPLLALAFIAVGAAALMIGAALNMAVDAIIRLAESAPALATFAQTIAQHLADFLLAAVALAALGVALVPLGAGLLIFGAGALVAGAGLLVLSMGIRAFLELVADLPTLIDNAVNSVVEFVTSIPERLNEFLTNISTWFTEEFLPNLGEFIQGIFAKLGELASGFWDWFTNTALPGLGQALSDFWNWVTTEGLPKLGEFIAGIFTKLGELASGFLSWLQSDGLPMLAQAAGDFWNWVTTEGLPKLGEFITGIFSKLGELLGQLGTWVINDGLPAIGQALRDLMDKAGEIGGMILDWAAGIPGYIADGIHGIWDQITSVGADIANGIIEGITGPAVNMAQGIADFGNNLMGGVKNFFGIQSPSKLMADEVGRYIPEGIAVGMNEYAYVAEQAGENVGDSTIRGVNNSLGNAQYNVVNPTITPTVDTSYMNMQYGITNPVINPVMNMGAFNQSLDAYRNSVTSMQVKATIEGETAVKVNFDSLIESLGRSLEAATSKLNGTLAEHQDTSFKGLAHIHNIISSQSGSIRDDLKEINEHMEIIEKNIDIHGHEGLRYIDDRLFDIQSFTYTIKERIEQGQNIYMDTGSLVGAIAPEMDNQLGYREVQSSRGNY